MKSLSRVWLFATPWTVKIIFFLFLTFLRFIFNWRIIALQCCAGFWCAMWISHKYTHIPLPPESPLQPLPPRHLGHHRAADWAPCDMQKVPTGYLLCTWQCLCSTATLSIHLIFFKRFNCPQRGKWGEGGAERDLKDAGPEDSNGCQGKLATTRSREEWKTHYASPREPSPADILILSQWC